MKRKIKSNKKKFQIQESDLKVNLPRNYPWKVLGLLAHDLEESLPESDFVLLNEVIRNKDLYSYKLLSESWSLQCINSNYAPLLEMKAKYVLSCLLKKFCFDTEESMRKETALKKFYKAESNCKDFNDHNFRDLSASKTEQGAILFTYARQFLQKLLGVDLPNGSVMTEWSRHGPGANLDTCNGKVSSFHKFDNWPYSCTVGAYRYARFAIESDQRWFGALQDDYRNRYNIPVMMPLNMELFWTRVLKVVDGNRITFVPKDAETQRTIAIEPALNLFLQLGVDGFIRRRLLRYGIDLDDQEKNRRLARQGSLNDGSWSFITIDLSAASDSMSLKLIELLLPPAWYSYLMDLRSPMGSVEGDSIVKYEKISSMGNGYTFALESVIFAAAIFAVQKYLHGKMRPNDCAIFGDDLIVTKNIASLVVSFLANMGFTINSEKSFFKGPVRESCGTDWFQGKPLRPVFFENTPTTIMELLTDINRLDRLLSLRFGLEESKVISKMEKWIPIQFKELKGPLSDEDFDSYRHCRSHNGNYKNCLWKYKRLVVRPRPLKTHKFLFKKLMHDLRPLAVPTQKWDRRLKGSGSRFTISRRNANVVSYTYSVSDIWRSMYTE